MCEYICAVVVLIKIYSTTSTHLFISIKENMLLCHIFYICILFVPFQSEEMNELFRQQATTTGVIMSWLLPYYYYIIVAGKEV